MDRRITLQTATPSVSATGQALEGFSNLATDLPAHKQDVSGNETNRNGEQVGMGITIWTIRHRTDFDIAGRVVDDASAEYDVTFAKEIGRRHWLELHTKRRTDSDV
tara:strand:- start:11526 stop:11843 length:318 start_codon:yes stop_codon:yes gene_type:complete